MKFSIYSALSAEQVRGFLPADLLPRARHTLREPGPFTLVVFYGHGVVGSRTARKALDCIDGATDPIVAAGTGFTAAAREALATRGATFITGAPLREPARSDLRGFRAAEAPSLR
ncbi:MAG TPA: hypothetical protein VNA89_14445 [Gemmatimonadaceae bacterium]|nr:hypothetical protein [Gemmatimonadaceae bacterium]